MGIWWKQVEKQDVIAIASNLDATVRFDGDLNAMPKDILQKWRKKQPWVILRVFPSFTLEKTPYYIYFTSKDGNMRYRWVLRAEYIAVRIGEHPITFVIEKSNSGTHIAHPRPLRQWSDVFYKDAFNGIYYSLDKGCNGKSLHFLVERDITWI